MGLKAWVTRPLICGNPYGMASGGQEEPFSRLALAVHCDESSLRAFHIPVQILAGKLSNSVLH